MEATSEKVNRQYEVHFEVNVINLKSRTLSVSRKKGTSEFHSHLSAEELQNHKGLIAAGDLTKQGLKLFDLPEITSIKLWEAKK